MLLRRRLPARDGRAPAMPQLSTEHAAEDAQPFSCLTLQYCGLGSLAEVLRRARAGEEAIVAQLTWPMRLSIAIQAAVGML